ncbi:amino acid permease [Nocardia sp. NPDC051570]|uniref:amino acid permease n=1 Tax=Nocardia sp. NPDC051570 TaxID=3364324 RepID=UPI0037977C9B
MWNRSHQMLTLVSTFGADHRFQAEETLEPVISGKAAIFLVLTIVPWDKVNSVESPYVTALAEIGIPFASTVMTFVILIAVLSVLNSMLYASSRVLHGLCRHGDAPRGLTRLNKRQAPARAILLSTIMGYLCVIAQAFWPEAVFSFLINSTGAILMFMYLTIAISQLRLRAVTERAEPERLTFKMWGYPYLTYLTVGALLLILVSMLFLNSTRPQLLMSLASLAVILIACGLRTTRRPRSEQPPRQRVRS